MKIKNQFVAITSLLLLSGCNYIDQSKPYSGLKGVPAGWDCYERERFSSLGDPTITSTFCREKQGDRPLLVKQVYYAVQRIDIVMQCFNKIIKEENAENYTAQFLERHEWYEDGKKRLELKAEDNPHNYYVKSWDRDGNLTTEGYLFGDKEPSVPTSGDWGDLSKSTCNP